MKKVLIGIFSGFLMAGIAAAQDNTTPSSTSSAATSATAPQTSVPAQSQTQQQLPPPETPGAATAPAATPQTQAPQAGAVSPQHVTRVAPGSVIPVSLTKTIDAKKAKAGDEVVAKVTQDMKSTTGEVIVAKDTKMVGHVTESQPRNKEQKESQVAISFDKAVTKDRNEMQMPMSIQAIIGPQNNAAQASQSASSANNDTPAPSSGTNVSPGMKSGTSGSMQTPTPTTSASNDTPGNSQSASASRPPITAQTQGVVGISNLTLTAAPNNAQGSLVTSDKNNVKIESGTMLLLRVSQ
jgi:hypothetical protein